MHALYIKLQPTLASLQVAFCYIKTKTEQVNLDLPIEDGFKDATTASKIQPFQYRLAIANFGAVYL